jgi:Ni,Fe-hydrogenase III component G
MSTESALQTATQLTAAWAKATTTPEANRVDISVAPSDLHSAVAALHGAHWGYLAAITGLDSPTTNEIELLYHFCQDAAVFTLRVSVPRDDAAVPTICDVMPSASLFEREVMEMFGAKIIGTPDTARLVLPDDWEEGVYPLRKDFVPTPDAQATKV